jgi:DNA-binding MarR family transcriptional regulator
MTPFESSEAETFNAFALAVLEVTAALNTSGDALTKPVGQSSARWRVLGRISQGPQTVSQIAQRIGNARQSVQRIADDLADQALAEYIPNPADRRAQLLQLTDQGWLALTAIETEQERWSSRIARLLDEQLLEQLTAGLRQVGREITTDFDQNYRQNDV